MAVNIKPDAIKSEPMGTSPPELNVNAMDDDKEKSYAFQQTMMKKEQKRNADEVSTSIQNLMEYREAPASPGASSVHSLTMDNLGSPTTPNSPPPIPPQEMDDERLPNELLDEICEDIGMKEGMELDFVEFLMEQDMVDPQIYMTPEAIRNTLATVASTPTVMSTQTVKSDVKNDVSNNRTCGSPSTTYSLASSTNCTVATSSGSSSPAAKRFHASTSGPTSPVRVNPPLSPKLFKAPQTPPTPRRPSSQSIASPSISSTQGPQMSPKPRCHSPQPSIPSSPSTKQPPSYSQSTGMYPGMQPHSTPQMVPQKGGIPPQMQRQSSVPHAYQRLGRPAPPNVNVQNMQQQPQMSHQQKWIQNQSVGNQCVMNNMGRQMSYPPHHTQHQYGQRMDSPLDQGYFSGDTSSVRSYGSTTSTVPSSLSSNPSAMTTIQNPNSMHMRQPQHMVGNVQQQQKTVHFADMPSDQSLPLQRQRSNDSMGYGPSSFDPNVPGDCDLENDFRGDPNHRSKIMPRLTQSLKSEIAPYTVPSSNGQVTMNQFGEYRNSSRPGSGENPMSNMQQFDFPQKPSEMFGVDSNQNSMHMNNFNSMQNPSPDINEPSDFRPSCSGGAPLEMNTLGHFDGGMPQRGSGMYGHNAMQETDQYKQNSLDMQNYCDNNQYRSMNSTPNMNGGCGMMGNPKMMGVNGPHNAPQGIMGQSCGQQGSQGYQGANFMPNGPCANNTPRSMHMGAAQMMGGVPTSVAHDYNQSPYNMNNGRMPPGTPNMNNMNSMYQNNSQTPISASSMGPSQQGGPMNSQQNWAGATPQTPQPQMGIHPKTPQQPHPSMSGMPPGTPQNMNPMQQGAGPLPQCTTPNCQSCKTGSPHRPPMLASQQTFIQHLITDRSNAFRSHPLFPLLRDLIIADMNFSSPSFPYQLISNLPAEFDKLLQNFLHRNPPSGNYQTNFSVESVVMDALKYAHSCLIEKIRSRQEQDKHTKSTSKSLSAIEEFCEKFDRSVRNTIIKPATFQVPNQTSGVSSSSMVGQQMDGGMTPTMGTPQKGMNPLLMHPDIFGSPQGKKGMDMMTINSPHFKSLKDLADISDNGSLVSSSSNHSMKSESKKHPSLPKEAVAIMLDWLRQHKDNPYPNDDEKAMLIKQTGLTINQINYWFTNARRRILPKWAQQCK